MALKRGVIEVPLAHWHYDSWVAADAIGIVLTALMLRLAGLANAAGPGRALADHRQVISGVFWRTRTGAPWRGPADVLRELEDRLLPASSLVRRWHVGEDPGPATRWM